MIDRLIVYYLESMLPETWLPVVYTAPQQLVIRMSRGERTSALGLKDMLVVCDSSTRLLTIASRSFGFRRSSETISFDSIEALDYRVKEVPRGNMSKRSGFDVSTQYMIDVVKKDHARTMIFRSAQPGDGPEAESCYCQTLSLLTATLGVPFLFNLSSEDALKRTGVTMVVCPNCAREIPAKRKLCLYCGERVQV